MRLTTLILVLCFVVSFSYIVGCDGGKKPEGFPDVIPHSIVVKNNGSAEDKVAVALLPQGASGAWAVGGETIGDGRARLATFQGTYTQFGVPAGDYKVILTKSPKAPSELSEQEYIQMSLEEREANARKVGEELKNMPKIIPDVLTTASKTPLTITISKDSKETVVELNDYKN